MAVMISRKRAPASRFNNHFRETSEKFSEPKKIKYSRLGQSPGEDDAKPRSSKYSLLSSPSQQKFKKHHDKGNCFSIEDHKRRSRDSSQRLRRKTSPTLSSQIHKPKRGKFCAPNAAASGSLPQHCRDHCYYYDNPQQRSSSGYHCRDSSFPKGYRIPRHGKEPTYYPDIHDCRSICNYQRLDRIDEGAHGIVYRGRDKTTNEIVALKKLKLMRKEDFPIAFLREIDCLRKAGPHTNIVNFREVVRGSELHKVYIVMDFVEHNLGSLIDTMSQPFLAEQVKTLLLQLLCGIHHLHTKGILHRDLKPSNLLLSRRGILKIGDFGLARKFKYPLEPYTPVVVTLWYRCPELLLGGKVYSTAVDMWSVGCIFGELILRQTLFEAWSEIDQIKKIFSKTGTPNEKIWPKYSQLPYVQKYSFKERPHTLRQELPPAVLTNSGFHLLERFLTYDPEKRISARAAFDHGYFNEDPVSIHPSMLPTWPAKRTSIV